MTERPGLTRGLESLLPLLEPVATRFEAEGHRLYLVGGIVRDLLVTGSVDDSDVDLTTDAHPSVIKRLVKPSASALWTQGERFGTIGARIGHRDVEITTHRAEQYDAESRKPVVDFGHDLHEDLSRRDFTVNAMAVSVPDGALHDPFGGQADLEDRVLRTPLSPTVSFTDDPLRMLRAARFLTRLDLRPTDDLVAAAGDMADRLDIVSVERVADELERLLAVADPSAGLLFLLTTGLLDHLIPQLPPGAGPAAVALAAVPSPQPADATDCDLNLARRAGLVWPVADVGKALSRLRYSNTDRRATVDLVESVRWWVDGQHASAADGRRLLDRVGADQLGTVTVLGRHLAAVFTTPEFDNPGGVSACLRLVDVIDALDAADDAGPYDSPLSGTEVMELLGLNPGPEVGRARQLLKQRRLEIGPFSADEARRVLPELMG